MQELHDAEFQKDRLLRYVEIVVKLPAPIFTDTDTARISKHLKMKVVDFQNKYLERDTDDFMVLKTAPCSFFDTSDNTCLIYNVRPKACAEYPHTNRKKFIQYYRFNDRKHSHLSSRVFNIVEALKVKIPYTYNTKKTRR